ncbi:MAG: hypothetical protein HKN27_05140 [Silicimonas sp.]|nr:hypothetical protein [Silicimonas sp.]
MFEVSSSNFEVSEMSKMSRIHRIAGLKISRVEAGSSLLPDLEPPEVRLRKQKSSIFLSDSIKLSHDSAMDDLFDPNLREEQNDAVARATVYVMNLIVMVFALPVGLALLCLNILGGANFRTTAHIMALTGLFMALSATEQGGQLLWMM